MTPNSDRSFPCFLWLSEDSSQQDQEFQERSVSDYVFFDPSADLKRSDGESFKRMNRTVTVSKSCKDISAQTLDLLSEGPSLCGG